MSTLTEPLITRAELQPGDILLYCPVSPWGWLIRLKTWSPVSHCETYAGQGKSIGARDGRGVNTYDLMTDHLRNVVRPPSTLDLAKMLTWHQSVIGKGYDWWGLMAFFRLGKGVKDRYTCSEHVTLAMRAGGIEFFQPNYPAQSVSPGMFLTSPIAEVCAYVEDAAREAA